MKKTEIMRNIVTITIPISLVIFGIGWLVFRSPIGAAVLPLIIFVASVYSNIGKYHNDIKRDSAGVTKKLYKATKAYDLMAPNDSVGPSLCIEVEDGKYLLLNGQWIYDENTYGEDAKEYYDEESDFFNGYRPPFSFPSTQFEMWVSNLDEKPARIIAFGDYLEPKEVNWPTPEKYYKCTHAVIEKEEVNTEMNL